MKECVSCDVVCCEEGHRAGADSGRRSWGLRPLLPFQGNLKRQNEALYPYLKPPTYIHLDYDEINLY